MKVSIVKARQCIAVPLGFLAVLSVLLLTGCAHQTVAHLKRNPWQLGQEQTLAMKYLTFEYVCSQETDSLRVRGSALVRPDTVPEWVVYAKDVWLGAYLSDRRGSVLAKDLVILKSQQLDKRKGFPFDVQLEPQDMGSPGPLFLTFGYRLVLTAGVEPGPDAETEKPVFFASESSLLNL
ncbi:MAG: hypothetical protein K9J81_10600 [Desulfohalobiaceae bacterium]|nr:hypothetical protein [Desulfohalobiaceae bacterium]